MIRWVLYRDGHAVTCELDACGRNTYDVSIVPHWNVAASACEHVEGALTAMECHAALVRRMRADGWVVVDHVTPGNGALAA